MLPVNIEIGGVGGGTHTTRRSMDRLHILFARGTITGNISSINRCGITNSRRTFPVNDDDDNGEEDNNSITNDSQYREPAGQTA